MDVRPRTTAPEATAEGGDAMNVKLVYTVREAAEVLCIGYSTARERIASGELRSFKDGSRRLITGEDLLAYVRDRRTEAA